MDHNHDHETEEYQDWARRHDIRFEQLPAATKRWLSELREEDLETLNDAISFQKQSQTVGRFAKWLIIVFVGSVMFMANFGQALSKLVHWALGKGG